MYILLHMINCLSSMINYYSRIYSLALGSSCQDSVTELLLAANEDAGR